MSSFKDNLYEVLRNPALIQTLMLNELDSQVNPDDRNPTYDIPDGTLPFVYLMECGSMETAANISEVEALMGKLYARQAQTQEDLYLHMSDDDYLNRFAVPASTPWLLILDYDEIVSKAVPFGDQGLKRLVIPRMSEFKTPSLAFTMQYPIQLTVMRHGGITLEYVLDKESPVQQLSTNIVKWDMLVSKRDNQRRRLMMMTIPMLQFKVNSYSDILNPEALFQTEYVFTDQFFYARAFISRDDETTWKEVTTTHSALMYNPADLTVVFKVVGNRLKVSIPTIYVTTGLATGSVRIDIYTTQGILDMDLGTVKDTEFSVKFNSIDDDRTFTAPLDTLTTCQVLARERITGGADKMPFETLRDQVINNTLGPMQVPITNVQLQAQLDRRGYGLVTNVDNITNLEYLATRRLSRPKALDVVSGAGVAMSEITFNMDSLSGSAHVSDNGSRMTLMPSMLYSFGNGKVNTLTDAAIARLDEMGAEQRAREMNGSRYVYSPFHNVLDATNNNFDMRPYYLDNPSITQKIFVGENDTANLQVAVGDYNITRDEKGYVITVTLEQSEAFRKLEDSQIVLQIGYQPTGEKRWASVNGTLFTKTERERTYQFKIETNYDIAANNELRTTNMTMFSNAQNNYYVPLQANFDVTICVVNSITPGYQPNELDEQVQVHLLPALFMTVNRDRLVTTLGYDLTRLWRRSRPVLSSESYKKYDHNIPAYYLQTVYATDANGDIIIVVKPDGTLDYQVLHRAGDPVLDEQGNPVMAHRIGDPMLDADGKPILLSPRKLMYETTLFMVDGLFYYANERDAAAYAKEIPMEIVNWIKNDIAALDAKLLSEAELFLFPTTTYGDTVASIREGQQITIPVDQSFTVSFYLNKSGYTNPTIRPSLLANAKSVINDHLQRSTISMSDILTKLTETSGGDVMAIETFGLGGTNNFAIITVEDEAVRLAVRKKLTVLPNQELTIEDDIVFNWLRHTLEPI
jgi:hypothetical protein